MMVLALRSQQQTVPRTIPNSISPNLCPRIPEPQNWLSPPELLLLGQASKREVGKTSSQQLKTARLLKYMAPANSVSLCSFRLSATHTAAQTKDAPIARSTLRGGGSVDLWMG